MRIRHYGILSSTSKKKSLTKIREQLPGELLTWNEPRDLAEPITPGVCPHCKTVTMMQKYQLNIYPRHNSAGQFTQLCINCSKAEIAFPTYAVRRYNTMLVLSGALSPRLAGQAVQLSIHSGCYAPNEYLVVSSRFLSDVVFRL